ncbi:membrane-associated proteins in eicosanoid and glutathione metabolism [Ascobolus immersus RN42]|uniref:Glutathione S-transferase 3, mitochondrial n=1 Tax=Ascobolus immersus RN42 TaxID=1160509 RepID=A0A3N4IPF3_ASCIM|nr:membrane-associated proteins in eicosanoid and glutathione metabolism [Ascobolus immersus RN42]
MAPIVISRDYGFVFATATASTIINTWHGMKVTSARQKAGIPYPNPYATAEQADKDINKYVFNCWQRAHQNYLENYPAFLALLFISGARYPLYAAGAGAIWLAGRIAYAIGYANPQGKEGKGRMKGAFQYVGLFGLLGLSGKTCWDLLA